MKNEKLSYKKTLSADAKLIIALLRKQPQKREELIKSAGIDVSTFYRNIPLLKWREIVKETKDGYALSAYIELEWAIENALDKLEKTESKIPLDKIASEVGVNPSEIKPMIYRIAKKRGMEVQHEKGVLMVVRENGVVIF